MAATSKMRYVIAVGAALYVAYGLAGMYLLYGGWPFLRKSAANPRHDVALVLLGLNCVLTLGMLACTVRQAIRFARSSSLKFTVASLFYAVTCVATVLAMSHWDIWFLDLPATPADEKRGLGPPLVAFSPALDWFSSNACNPWGVDKFFLHDFHVLFGLGCMTATFLDVGITLAKWFLWPRVPRRRP